MRKPGTAASSEGKRIRGRDRAMIDDPGARADLPERVAIIQNRWQEQYNSEYQAAGDRGGGVKPFDFSVGR
jgi:hypothetical protein